MTDVTAVEQLADGGRIHQFHWVTLAGRPQTGADKLLLVALKPEGGVEQFHSPLLVGVEPVAEARPPRRVVMGIFSFTLFSIQKSPILFNVKNKMGES